MENTILAIDPGSSKCGMALVKRDSAGDLAILWRKIAPTETLADSLAEAFSVEQARLVVFGSGTKSKDLVALTREAYPSMGILVIDEKDTTLQARERYWEHHKRRGWRRIIPASMQVPPEPVDDFVAIILAERVLTP